MANGVFLFILLCISMVYHDYEFLFPFLCRKGRQKRARSETSSTLTEIPPHPAMRSAGPSCVCIAPRGRRALIHVLTQTILTRVITVRAVIPGLRATFKGDHLVAIGRARPVPEIEVFEDRCQARLHLGLVDGLALALVAVTLLATAAAVRAIGERRYSRRGRAFVKWLNGVGHATDDEISAAFVIVWIVGSIKGNKCQPRLKKCSCGLILDR